MKNLLMALCLFGASSVYAQTKDSIKVQSLQTDTLAPTISLADSLRPVQKTDTVTIVGVGDIMMGSNYPDSSTLPMDDGRFLMSSVKDVLRGADVTMGNLEGVLLDSGGTAKTCHDPSICYVFRSPTRFVENLVAAGFDVMSLANNHAGDFGDIGRRSSMKTLDSAGIATGGLLDKPYSIFKRDSLWFGFAAFAPNTGCLSIHDIERAQSLVRNLKAFSDIVIVSFHGGGEGKDYQHVTRNTELFYGEDRGNVYQFAHALIDAGADVVFGQGPHVSRAIEVYKNRFIAYSLGNFCTHGRVNIAGVNGLAPIAKVYTSHNGIFLGGKIIAAYQTYADGVMLDPENRVIMKIKELTEKDFPESQLLIGDDGIITYLQTR